MHCFPNKKIIKSNKLIKIVLFSSQEVVKVHLLSITLSNNLRSSSNFGEANGNQESLSNFPKAHEKWKSVDLKPDLTSESFPLTATRYYRPRRIGSS